MEHIVTLEKSHTCTHFAICSKGEIQNKVGFVATENSAFEPDEITALLGIQPFKTAKTGQLRKHGKGVYTFSNWSACQQNHPPLDVETQCLAIIQMLENKIPTLLQIKEKFAVDFFITIVPHIYNEQSPILFLNKKVMEFCHITGTEINIDLFIYNVGEANQ